MKYGFNSGRISNIYMREVNRRNCRVFWNAERCFRQDGDGFQVSEIKLGCYTGPWGSKKLIQAISQIGESGFDGMEAPAPVVMQYEDRLHVFEEILETAGISLAGLIQTLDMLDREHADEQVERAANSARFVSAAGASYLTICHSSLRDAPMNDEEWATFAAIIEEIGQRCSEFGIQVCFMPRAQKLVCSEKDIHRLLAMTDPNFVKLSLDTAEISLAGGNVQRLVKACLDRIMLIRYHDASGSKRRLAYTSDELGSTPQFGRGAVKFNAVSKVLLDGGFSGWVMLDVTGEDHDPLEAAVSGFRFLMRKSGLFPV